MTPSIVRAGGSAEFIIWIVLGIIWVIAQMAARSRKRGPTRPPSQPRSPAGPTRSVEDDLAAFFESLTSAQKPPDDSLSKPLPPIPYGAPAPRPGMTERSRKLARKRAATAPRPAPRPPEPPASIPELEPPRAPDVLPDLRKLRAQTPAPRAPTLASKGFRMPGIRLGGSPRQGRGRPGVKAAFAGRKALRLAVISRVVLGPPKAFG